MYMYLLSAQYDLTNRICASQQQELPLFDSILIKEQKTGVCNLLLKVISFRTGVPNP